MLDAVAADLIGFKPADIPTIKAAMERGLLPEDMSSISLYGDPSRFRIPDFRTVPAQSSVFFHVLGEGVPGKIAYFVAARILTPFPKLDKKYCIGCGKCAQLCPAKAIAMIDNKPRINRKICIHCFCCQEFCPKGAMKPGRTILSKLYSHI